MAAAAVSISSNLLDIALNGVESVRVSFRFGIHVDSVSQSLECREANGTPESWSYVVIGISAEEVKKEIEQYNKESVNSGRRRLETFILADLLLVQHGTHPGLHQRVGQELCFCQRSTVSPQRRFSTFASPALF